MSRMLTYNERLRLWRDVARRGHGMHGRCQQFTACKAGASNYGIVCAHGIRQGSEQLRC